MKAAAALVLALACAPAVAGDLPLLPGRYDLSQADIAREFAYVGTLVLDYSQTMDIKNHPKLEEKNKMLGQHPSDVKIRNYFLASALTHYVITKLLPSEYRPYWQYGGIIYEGGFIISNHHIGLAFKF